MKSKGNTKVIVIPPLGTMNICSKLNGTTSDNCEKKSDPQVAARGKHG